MSSGVASTSLSVHLLGPPTCSRATLRTRTWSPWAHQSPGGYEAKGKSPLQTKAQGFLASHRKLVDVFLDHSSASLAFPSSKHLVIPQNRKNGSRTWHQ